MIGGREIRDLAGELSLRIEWDGRRVRHVEVRSTRPSAACRLFAGKRATETMTTLPLLFSVCRHAQRAAARGAIEAATLPNDPSASHELSVLMETLQEHLAHILVDIPRAMFRDDRIAVVADVRKRIDTLLRTIERGLVDRAALRELATAAEQIAVAEIYAMPTHRWLGFDSFDDVRAWAKRAGTFTAALVDELLGESPSPATDVALMPSAASWMLLANVVPAMKRDSDFAHSPAWNGAPVETGALARVRDHPIVSGAVRHCANVVAVRFIARIVELGLLVGALSSGSSSDGAEPPTVQAFSVADGEGVAAVQTARGLLLHRARVVDDRVTDYQIVAPTDWNFGPRGPAARLLADLVADDDATLERRANLTVKALDPCVAYRIEIGHA